MIYAISDVHGHYDKFIEMLEKIQFNASDTMYILGDIVDRGPKNMEMIFEVMSKKNIIMLKGNHEHIMHEVCRDTGYESIYDWYRNGGEITDSQFNTLDYQMQEIILKFIGGLPLQIEIEVNGKNYLLTHGHYRADETFKNKPEGTRLYTEDILFNRIVYYDKGLDDRVVIFGHTPTCDYQGCEPYRIWTNRYRNLIGIDCGMAGYSHGNKNSRLGCLRLDDMKEFYV